MTLLRPTELDIVKRLVESGLFRNASVLAVVMVTREHSRPEGELVDIVRAYADLHDRDSALAAIQELRHAQWLVEQESYGKRLIHQAPDLREKIASRLGDARLADQLSEMRAAFQPDVRVIGSITDEFAYTSYLALLQNAQKEVLLPMLATSPNLASAAILKERARKGVVIRALLASPAIVAALRGESNRKLARDAIRGWAKHAREAGSNFRVRIAIRRSDTILSTSLLVDDAVLRIDIYDPDKQRSLEGVLVEAKAPPSMTPNLLRLYRMYFDHAWNRARPTSVLGSTFWFIQQNWRWLLFFVLAGLTLISYNQNSFWAGIWSSAAAALLINAAAISFARGREFVG